MSKGLLSTFHAMVAAPPLGDESLRERSARSRILLYAQPLFLFCLTLVVATIFSRLSADTHHDGVLLKPAIDVANGKMLFRDSFTQYGALTTLFQALGIKLFGPYLIVIKTTTALFYALVSVLLWMNWSRIIAPWLATLCGVIWLSLAPFLVAVAFPWSSVYALVFQLGSAYCMLLFVERPRKRYTFVAGVLTGLCFWCRQPTGVFNALALLAVPLILTLGCRLTLRQLLTHTSLLVGGIAATFAVFLSWLAANAALPDWYAQSILFSFAFGETFGGGTGLVYLLTTFFPFPYSPWSSGYVWDLLPAASLVLLMLIIARWWPQRLLDEQLAKLLVSLIFALASWHQYFPFPDFMKAFWANGFMVGLLAALMTMVVPLPNLTWRNLVAGGLTMLLILPHAASRWSAIANYYHMTVVPVDRPEVLRGMLFSQAQAEYLSSISLALDVYLANHPQTNVINATSDALFLTFRDDRARSFHPAHVKWGILQYVIYPDYQTSLLDYMTSEQPLAFVYLPPDVADHEGFEEGLPFVFNGEERFSGYAVYQRFAGGLALIAPARCLPGTAVDTCNRNFE